MSSLSVLLGVCLSVGGRCTRWYVVSQRVVGLVFVIRRAVQEVVCRL